MMFLGQAAILFFNKIKGWFAIRCKTKTVTPSTFRRRWQGGKPLKHGLNHVLGSVAFYSAHRLNR